MGQPRSPDLAGAKLVGGASDSLPPLQLSWTLSDVPLDPIPLLPASHSSKLLPTHMHGTLSLTYTHTH